MGMRKGQKQYGEAFRAEVMKLHYVDMLTMNAASLRSDECKSKNN